MRDLAVVVEVVHHAVVIAVDVDVRRVAVHVTAEVGSARRCCRRPSLYCGVRKPLITLHAAHVDAVRLQVAQHELELVDVPHLQHEVLRPDVRLVVREEVAKLEVLGDAGVRVLPA